MWKLIWKLKKQFIVRRKDNDIGWIVSGANSNSDWSDEFDLQSVHIDMQKVRRVVLAIPRYPGRRGRCAPASDHSSADRARVAVRLAHRQGRLQDQGNPRSHRGVDPGRVRDAAQLDWTHGHHLRHQRSHHTMHIPHMLRHARGTSSTLFIIISAPNAFQSLWLTRRNLVTFQFDTSVPKKRGFVSRGN